MKRQAQLGLRLSSGTSISAQDFTFGKSMWDSAHGNADSASVSGISSGVADIASDARAIMRDEDRKKDDPAIDAALILEAAERVRKDQLRIGRMNVSREDLVLFTQAMQDPEFREKYKQALRDKGVPEHEIEDRADKAQRMAKLGIKVLDGTATSAESDEFDRLQANPEAAADFEIALNIKDRDASFASEIAPEVASFDNSDDAIFLAAMVSDASAPPLAAAYNSAATKAVGDETPVDQPTNVETKKALTADL